jgi:hypothetical protein
VGRPITIDVPDDVYEPLSQVAIQEGRLLEEVASEWLKLAAQRGVDGRRLKLMGNCESDASDLGERVTMPPANKQRAVPNGTGLSIEEKIQRIAAEIPDSAWDNLPTDLSDNLDHYLYGTPKK